jgi:HlyD family secretion protein
MILKEHYWLIGAVVFILFGCDGKVSDKAKKNVDQKETEEQLATPAMDMSTVRGTCTIRSAHTVKLKAQVGGEITAVLVEQGAAVKSGQVLATVDVANLKLKKERLEIELKKQVHKAELLSFQLSRAEKEYSVVAELVGKSSENLPKYGKEMAGVIERKSSLREAELEQETVKLDIKTLEEQIRKSSIRAPFDGIVLARSAEPGMVVGSASENIGGSEVLFEVADPSKMIAACIVKESDSLAFKSGSTASLAIDGNSAEKIQAKVGRVSPIIQNDSGISRRELMVVLPSDRKIQLLPGMNAIVEIDVKPLETSKN